MDRFFIRIINKVNKRFSWFYIPSYTPFFFFFQNLSSIHGNVFKLSLRREKFSVEIITVPANLPSVNRLDHLRSFKTLKNQVTKNLKLNLLAPSIAWPLSTNQCSVFYKSTISYLSHRSKRNYDLQPVNYSFLGRQVLIYSYLHPVTSFKLLFNSHD